MEAKGTLIEAIVLFVKTKYGEDGFKKLLDSLPPESRKHFEGIVLVSKWYPFREAVEAPTLKICDLFYGGRMEGAKEMGKFSAEHALRGIYKLFVKLGSPEFIIGKASTIFAGYYQPCAMEIINKGDHTNTLRITQFDQPSKVVEQRIVGWMLKGLEISGSKSPTVTIAQSLTDGAPFSDFVITW